ncbi:putative mRNA-decapping enzyme 1B-like [Apostichopus japonicus]|uniref:Putative mRNA-decapping enzyme 1B-like n=1 Tax=Stichopus japonicus TaxID=307972 RepID=A0A2G8JUC8_STIJA|nr:putative mRNA-decapping enzyme 1B-like [Apostichopus japonicus]
MASDPKERINLAALQQNDPYIERILETAGQVALYNFNAEANEWEKTDVQGTMFIYTRHVRTSNGELKLLALLILRHAYDIYELGEMEYLRNPESLGVVWEHHRYLASDIYSEFELSDSI